MKPTKRIIKPKIVDKAVDLDALTQGSQAIAFQPPQITVYGDGELSTGAGKHDDQAKPSTLGVVPGAIDGMDWPPDWHEGQEGWPKKAGRETGGRSESFSSAPQVTAKPLSPISPLLSQNPGVTPPSDMPVLGDLRGVHRKEDPKVVESCHVGGIHSKNGPILGHSESNLVTTSLNVPYSPDVPEPMSTQETTVASPFITGNGRIDRRTAFTQYCRLGEGRTYIKVAEIMAVPVESIKEWAKGDNWENAYRERVTADIVQVAKEENIHEVLDIRREVIAQLKQRIQDAKTGPPVFQNEAERKAWKPAFSSTKELLDTMLKLEELTGASTANTVRPGQIFVIIDKEEWEAREKLNEQARLEEAKA